MITIETAKALIRAKSALLQKHHDEARMYDVIAHHLTQEYTLRQWREVEEPLESCLMSFKKPLRDAIRADLKAKFGQSRL